jgi:hypothetical protein
MSVSMCGRLRKLDTHLRLVCGVDETKIRVCAFAKRTGAVSKSVISLYLLSSRDARSILAFIIHYQVTK